jgi:antitoxin YefM
LYIILVPKQEHEMTIQTNYTQARGSLASLMDVVTDNHQVVIIQRRGKKDVALVPVDVLESVHLLRSPGNARRLLNALGRALRDEGSPLTFEQLQAEAGIGE